MQICANTTRTQKPRPKEVAERTFPEVFLSFCESKVRCIDDVFVVMLRGDRRNPADSFGQRLCQPDTVFDGMNTSEGKNNALQALVRLETVLHSFRAFSVSEVSAEPYLRKQFV